uniref:Uncharacterized protein n=1 Tax=Cacopsylla melanoneura TaxID=428564 RepID=A0A8D8QAL7_9HEMI
MHGERNPNVGRIPANDQLGAVVLRVIFRPIRGVFGSATVGISDVFSVVRFVGGRRRGRMFSQRVELNDWTENGDLYYIERYQSRTIQTHRVFGQSYAFFLFACRGKRSYCLHRICEESKNIGYPVHKGSVEFDEKRSEHCAE